MEKERMNEVAVIHQAVEALLHSEQLAKSPALIELLVYLRDRSEDAKSNPTTEYAIAQDVLGKDSSFDPKLDTVVRVRIKRLREALNAYYLENPKKLQLHIPNRSYDLHVIEKKSEHRVKRLKGILTVGTVLAVSITGLLVWFLNPSERDGYPLIRVLPIQNLTNDNAVDFFEGGLQRQIATDLQRFGRVRVFVADPPRRDIEDADFTLRGSILGFDDEIDVALRLELEEDSSLVFGDRVTGKVLSSDYFTTLSEIAWEISGLVAGKGGPTTAFQTGEATAGLEGLFARSGVGTKVFQCLIYADQFFENYESAVFLDAYYCFDSVRDQIGDDPFARSQWATLGFHTVPELDLMDTQRLPPDLLWTVQDSLDVARSTVEQFPSSSDAFLLLGSVQNAIGQYREAELSLRQSVGLNPGDPTARAVLAYFLMANEKFEGAIESAQEAIELSAVPQAYIYLPITLSALAIGDQETAVSAGTEYANRRTGDGATSIELIVARLKDDQEVIDRLAPQVSEMDNPLAGFSSFVKGERLKGVLEDLLPEADLSFL